MLRHYLELKSRHPDALLFYRMGDFFELFFEDAKTAAGLLDLTLTARQKGTENEAPMCGVPHHAAEGYIGRLLRMGRKVVVCDQTEDPKLAKGLVRREVTRIYTPGTLSDTELLEGKEQNFLAALVWESGSGAGAFLDVSTGAFFVRRFRSGAEALGELESLRPRELLAGSSLPEEIEGWGAREGVCRTELDGLLEGPTAAAERLRRHFGVGSLRGFGLEEGEPAVRAAAAALAYAQGNQLSDLSHVREIALATLSDRLEIDATTLANLEVFRNLRDGGLRGTLLELLDATATAPGGRLLREWLRRPLRDPAEIGRRQDAVAAWLEDSARRGRVRERLQRLADFERLASRAVVGSLAPREAAALRDALGEVPALLAEVSESTAAMLAEAAAADPVADLADLLAERLAPSPAASVEDGGVIREGIDPDLDEARSLARDSKRHILAVEARERERTGIASLKVRYNRVFGYSIEVSKANAGKVPAEYVRRQTLVHAERYVTPEIQGLEAKILDAEQRQLELERTHYESLRRSVAEAAPRLLRLGAAVARVDVVAGWAELAATRGYCRPQVVAAGAGIRIADGRHPMLERILGRDFVPNDADLDPAERQIVLLTGPNMGGKSTYLRQVALLVVMAQTGSFVPAREANLGAVDRVFSRVGASDDLARGESTFMVEMIETANILRFATADSLVILDEVGRGTATFDGLSLAWAIVEHLHEGPRPLTLFATHYHELTELEALLPRVVNRTMAVKEWEDRILFLRRVIPGTADKSYGLHVARLAGLPGSVVERAGQVLANLESHEYDPQGRPRLAEGSSFPAERPGQMPLFTPAEEVVARVLREADLDRMTPLAALNLLVSLKDRLE